MLIGFLAKIQPDTPQLQVSCFTIEVLPLLISI